MQQRHLKTAIINKLLPGPQHTPSLVEEVSFTEKVTVQGVYKALRELGVEEVISIHNKYVSLSLIWLSKEREKLQFAEKAYHSTSYIKKLENDETHKIVFGFKTLKELDLFWTHSYILLTNSVDTSLPSYSIQPHDWYYYARLDTDAYWVRKHIESERISRIVLTHSSELDRVVMRERKKKLGRLFEFTVNQNPLQQKSNVYYNVLGEYIFKVIFDSSINDELERFIKRNSQLPFTREIYKEIEGILSAKGLFTLTIYKSEAKSTAIEKKVKKYFE